MPSNDPSPTPDDAAPTPQPAEASPADRDLILDLNFVPDWAKKSPADAAVVIRKESQGGRERRPRRDGPKRDSGKRPAARDGGKGRPQHGGGGGGGRDRRPETGNYGARPRPSMSRESRAPMSIRFVPDDQHLIVILKKLRNTARAYPLLEITSLFLNHPDTCRALIEVDSRDATQKLYQCTQCGAVAFDEKTLHTHLLNNHMDDLFVEESIEAEPPKGNFVCVRKCGLSGELLGPPNHNSTETRILDTHATRFSNMTIERYREHIKTLHDSELIEAWKEQWRTQKIYRLKSDVEKATPAESAPSETDSTPSAEAPDDTETPTDDAVTADDTVQNESVQEETAQAEATTDEAVASTTPSATDDIKSYSQSEAAEYFLNTHGAKMIRKTFRATVPAAIARETEDPALRERVLDAWRRECQAPRSMTFAIRGAFKHRKMHIFKAGKQMEFVTATPPAPLDPERATESIGEVLRFLQEHPGCARKALVEGLRPGASSSKERANEILGPLSWMVERGHIIEFFDGTLAVPRGGPSPKRRPPKQDSAKAEAPAKAEEPAKAATDEVAEETPADA